MNCSVTAGTAVVATSFMLFHPLALHAADPVVIPGTAWTVEGRLNAKAKGKKVSPKSRWGSSLVPRPYRQIPGI